MTEPLLAVEDLAVHFPVKVNVAQSIGRAVLGFVRGASRRVRDDRLVHPRVHAVDGISFELRRGEILGLVGESGCGKTTTGRAVLRLVEPTGGRIRFEGRDITHADEAEIRSLRPRMQIVFQDPHAALNPAMTIGQAIMDPLLFHVTKEEREAQEATLQVMEQVGLTPARDFFGKYPPDLSGGQKQRAVLARAIALKPSLIVADEPVAMLDMSVRARILELMLDLKRQYGLTYLFITHDLATAKLMCDRVAIMYLGKFVEEGEAARVYSDPKHPYTQALLSAVPIPDPERRRTKTLPRGEVPDALHPPSGCRFHPRCPVARADCGWEGADIADFLERRRLDPVTAQADEAVLGPLSSIRTDGATLRIAVPQGTEATAVEHLRGLAGGRPDPMFSSVESIDAGVGEVSVVMRSTEDVAFRTVDGVRVACVLY